MKMELKGLIIFVVCFAASNGGPVQKRHRFSKDDLEISQTQQNDQVPSLNCASTCQKNDKFNYHIGYTYMYDYTADTETKIAGSSEDLSYLQVKARAHITALSPCNMELKFSDVDVSQSNSKGLKPLDPPKRASIKAQLEEYPMIFAFRNGQIDNICPYASDYTWAMNFKRGFLSTLQNTMKDVNQNEMLQETDVSGQCKTNYVINKHGWSTIVITKTKDLDSCTKRSSAESMGIQLAPYFSNLGDKPLPILKSRATCEQVISTSNQILQSVKCTEIHLLKPFSNDEAGILTRTKQEVVFLSSQRATSKRENVMPHTSRTSLLFDHIKIPRTPQSNVDDAEKVLKEICSAQTINLHTPTLFKKLVVNMRQLQEEELFIVYSNINRICSENEVVARKFYLDALHMTVTPASAAFIMKLIQSNQISEEMKNSWLLTLAFIPSPIKEFVVKFAPLLDEENPRQNAVLGLSALVHTYCHQPSIECSKDQEILHIAEKFTNNLKTGCKSEDKVIEKILISLKAIGNVGHLTKADEKLKSCYVDTKNEVEVRVAAIDALRHWPCETQRKPLLKILSDYEEDVEVRITSYLSLMRCPTSDTLEAIRQILEKEQVNQVGSFIWTHLINLQKTSISSRKEIKSIIQSYILREKFSTDALKFSRAYEKSFYSETYETGLHGQANLIFTPKSYLPRSLTTNLTIDLFGHSINLIEVGGHMEGFEKIFESMFGPNGYFPEKTVHGVLKSMRGKRDLTSQQIEEQMDEINREYNAGSEFPENPQASAYMRLFGSDIYYNRYDGTKNFEHFLSWLFNKEETSITESFTFVDTSLIIPTQIGLPLNLTLNGTAIIQLLMKGHTHVKQIFNLNCDISGYIKPSAAIQITGSMSVNTPDLELGVRLDATMHTSTSLSGKLVLKGGKLVRVEIDAPEERMEVININSQLFLMEGDDAIPKTTPEFIVERFDLKACSGIVTRNILGLDICTEYSYPNASEMVTAPGFPLTGPTMFSVYIDKSDPQLTSYNFEYQWEDQQIDDQFVKTKRLYLDTPGTNIDRQFLAELVINEPQKSIKASLRTPFKKFGLHGKLVNEKDEKKLDGVFTMDDVEKIVLQAEIKRDEYGDTQRYSPRLHLQVPYLRPIDLKGYFTIHKGVKIALDMTLENLTVRPITITGDINISNNLYDVDINFKSYLITTHVKANVQIEEKHITGNVNTDFSLLERWHRSYGLTFKYKDESLSNSVRKLTASGEIQGSGIGPVGITWEIQQKNYSIENQLDFTAFGKTFATKQVFSYEKDAIKKEKYMATLTAKCFDTSFDWTLTAIHERSIGAMTSSIELYKEKSSMGKIQAHVHLYLKPLMNIGAEVNLRMAEYLTRPGGPSGYDVRAVANVKKLNTNEYEGKIYIQIQPGEKAEVLARYQDYSTSQNKRHAIKIDATSSWGAALGTENELSYGNGGFSTNNILQVNNVKYALLVDYNPKSNEGHQLKTVGSIDGRYYGADASYKTDHGTTKVYVNLKRNGYKPISMKLEFRKNGNDMSGDARIIWNPEHESGVNVEYNELDHGFHIGVNVDGICGIHEANFETSTQGHISDSLYLHKSSANLITNNKEYKMGIEFKNSKYKGVYDSSLETILGIADHVYKLEGDFKLQDKNWNGNGRFHNDQNDLYKMKTNGRISKWEYPEFDFNGNMELESSRGVMYTFGLNHVNTKKQFKSSIYLPTFWKNREFNLTIEGMKNWNENLIQYSGAASLQIENENSYSISGSYQLSGEERIINMQIGRNGKFVTLRIDTESNYDGKASKHLVGIGFTSPFKYFENVKASMKHELGEYEAISNIDASWSNEDSLNSQVTVTWESDDEGFSMVLYGDLKTPFDVIKHVTAEANHAWKRGILKELIALQRNDKSIASFELESFTPSIRNVDIKVNLMVPVLEEMSSKLIYVIGDEHLEASLDLVYGINEIKGKLKGFISSEQEINGDLEITTSMNLLPYLHVNLKHAPKTKFTFDTTIEVKTSENQYLVKIEQQLKTDFKHSTSFWSGNDKKYSLDFEKRDENLKRTFILELTTPSGTYGPYQGEFTWSNNGGVQQLIVGLEYAPGQKITVGASTDFGQYRGKIHMDIYTPFENFHKISVSLLYSLLESTRIGIAIEWDEGGKFEINSLGHWSATKADIQINVLTSYYGYENITTGLKYDFRPTFRKKILMLYTSIKDKMVKLQGSAIYNKASGEVDVQITTPFEEWKVIGGKIKANSNKNGQSIRVQLRRNEKRIDGSLTLKPLHIVGRLRTPYENFHSMYLEWRLDKEDHNFMSTLLLKKDSFSLDASAMYKQTTKEKFNVNAKLNIPSTNTKLGISGNGHLEVEKMQGNLNLNHNDNKLEVSAEIINTVKNKQLLVIFKSPLNELGDIKISASYANKDPFHYMTSFSVQQNSKSLHLISSLTHESEGILASLTLTSDYDLIPAFDITAKQDNSTPTKTALFTLGLGDKYVKVVAKSTTEYTLREGSLSFESNFLGNERKYSGSYRYDLGRPQKVMTLQFAKNGRAIDVHGTYEHNTEEHPGSLVASLADGINGQNVYVLNINHEMLKHVKVIDFIVHKNNWMSDFIIKWSTEADVLQFTSEITAPGLDKLSLEGEIGQTTVNVKVGLNEDVAELSGDITRRDGQGTFHLFSKSNTDFLSEWTFKGGYDIYSSVKSFWLQMSGVDKEAELTGSYTLEKDNGKVELKLKVVNDKSEKSESLVAHFDLTKSQQSAGIKLQRNDDVIDAQLTWVPGRYKGVIKIDITTPIPGYSSLGGELQYNLDRTKTLISSYVQWMDNKKISVDFSASIINVVGSLVISTPFPDTKKIEVKLEPSFNAERKNTLLSIKYGKQKEVKINIDWQLHRQVGELLFRVDSTFADFKRFLVKFSYDIKSDVKMMLALSWPGEINHSKDLLATFDSVGYAVNTEITFGSYDKVFHINKIKLRYSVGAEKKFGYFLIEKGSEKVELKADYEPEKIVHITLHTPHQDYRTISGELSMNQDDKSAILNAQWNDKNIKISASCKLDSLVGHVESNIESNWELIQTSKILLQYDLKAPLLYMKSEFHYNQYNIDFSLQALLTEHYTLNLPQKSKPIVEATLKWNNKQEIQFIVEGHQDMKSGSASAKILTSFSPCKNNYISINYNIKPSVSLLRFSAVVCEQETDIAGKLHADKSKWSINSHWKSSFFSPGSLDGALDLKVPGDNMWITLQWAHSTIEVKGNVNYDNGKVDTRLVLRNSFVENNIIIVGSYDGALENPHFNLEIDFGEGDKVHILGDVNLENNRVVGGSVKLMTPLEGLEDFSVKLKYLKNKQKLLGDLIVVWGSSENQKLEARGLFTNNNINIEMITPLTFLKNFALNTTLYMHELNFDFETKVNWNNKDLLDTTIKYQNNLPRFLYFTADFYTPLTNNISSSISFFNDKNSLLAFLHVKCDKMLIHIDTNYDHHNSALNATAQLQFVDSKLNMLADWSPYEGKFDFTSNMFQSFYTIFLQGKFVNYANREQKEIDITLRINESTHSLKGLLELYEGSIVLSADLISPFFDSKSFSVHGKGTYKDGSGNIELEAKCSRSDHAIIADFNWQTESFYGTATINCPFISETTETIKLHGTFTKDIVNTYMEVLPNHKLEVEINIGAEKQIAVMIDSSLISIKRLELGLVKNNNGFKVRGLFQTVRNSYDVSFGVKKSEERNGISVGVDMSLKTRYGYHELMLSCDFSAQLISGTLQLDTSLFDINDLLITFKLENKLPREVIAKFDIEMKNKNLLSFSWSLQRSRNEFLVQIDINTNYLNIKNVSLQTRFYINDDVLLTIKVGRLATYHSLTYYASVKGMTHIRINLVLFEGRNMQRNISLSISGLNEERMDGELTVIKDGRYREFFLSMTLDKFAEKCYTFDMVLETYSTGLLEIKSNFLFLSSRYEFDLQFWKDDKKHSSILTNLWTSSKVFNFDFKFSTPIIRPSFIQLRLHMEKTENNENLINGAFTADDVLYSIIGKMGAQERNIYGELKLTGHCCEPIKIIFEIQRQDRNGQILVDIFTGEGKFEARGTYQYPSSQKLNIDLLMNTPIKKLEWIKVNINYSKSDEINVKLEMTASHHDLNGVIIQGTLNTSYQKPKVKISIRTPLKILPALEALGYLNYNSDLSDIELYLNVETASKSYIAYLTSKLDKHQSSISVSCGTIISKKKYEFHCSGKYIEGENIGMSLDIVFASNKIFSSVLEYVVQDMVKKWSVDVNIEEYGRYSANLEVTPRFLYRINIATPFKKFKHLFAECLTERGINTYTLQITYSNDRIWFLAVSHGIDQVKVEIKTPQSNPNNAEFQISQIKRMFLYNGIYDINVAFSKKGNSYTFEMLEPLQFEVKWTVNSSIYGTRSIIGEVTTDTNQRATTTSSFVYQDNRQGIKLNIQSNGHLLLMTTSVERMATNQQRGLNVTFDGKPFLKLNMNLEDKHLDESVEKSVVLSLWYPDREVRLEMRYERGVNMWSSGLWLSFEKGRMFGLIMNVIPYNHFNLRLQLPEETLYFQLLQIPANKKDPYQLQAYLGFLNKPESRIDFNLRWKNENGQVNGEIALVQPRAEMKSKLNFIDKKNEMQFKLQFETLLQSRVNYTMNIEMTCNKPKKTLEIKVHHPPHLGDLKLLANMKSVKSKDVIELRITELDAKMKTKKLFDGSVELHNKSVLFNYIYGNDDTITASLSMPTARSIEFDVSHGHSNDIVTDFSSKLTLNSSRSLIGDINWRPGSILNAMKNFVQEYFSLKDEANKFALKLQDNLYFALLHQKDEATQVFDSIKQRIENTWEKETKGFSEDLKNFASHVKELYDDNKFGIRSLVENLEYKYGSYVRNACYFILDNLSHGMYELRYGVQKIYHYFTSIAQDILSNLDQCLLNIQNGIHHFAQDPDGTVRFVHKRLTFVLIQMAEYIKENLVNPLFQKATPHINYLIDRLKIIFQHMVINFTEYMKEIIKSIKHIPAINQVIKFVSDWLPDKETLQVLEDYYHKLVSKYVDIFNKGSEIVESWAQHPAVVQVTDFASKVKDKFSWMYNYMEIQKHAAALIEIISNQVKESFVQLMQELTSHLPKVNYYAPRMVADTEKGQIKFHQPLPVEWDSFKHMPRFKPEEEIQKMINWKDMVIKEAKETSFTDLWNHIWSKLSSKYGFGLHLGGRAFLAGNQHFKTFDGLHYEFAGNCYYILASDFIDGEFTAIVNYLNNKKKSILLQFDKTILVFNTADGKLEVNSQKSEYPFQLNSVTATRNGDVVTIQQGRTFQMECSIQLNICTFDIARAYHGKIGGLFGNFDKESSNDFITSDREQIEDIVKFANSWVLGDCLTKTNMAAVSSDSGRLMATICSDLLDDINSSLQKCFKKVNPSPYYKMCINDVSNMATTKNKAALIALAAYVAECNYNDIKVQMPADSVHCSLTKSEEYNAEYTIRFSGLDKVRSADTVLLYEEKYCNFHKNFEEKLVKAMENTFSKHNIHDNQYSLVGFSGDDINDQPHIHTMNGQVYGSWQDLIVHALPKLEKGNGYSDFLTSLRFVTNMPFRPAVRRNVVAFLCDLPVSTSDLDVVQNQMKSQGIALHVISNRIFKSDIIACDKTHGYTLKSEAKTCPTQLLDSIESKLALQSNGSIFTSSYLKTDKPKIAKKALDLLVKQIIEKSMPTCQVCKCEAGFFGAGKSVCQPCEDDVVNMNDGGFYTELEDYLKDKENAWF